MTKSRNAERFTGVIPEGMAPVFLFIQQTEFKGLEMNRWKRI